jgi:hypothetical protein
MHTPRCFAIDTIAQSPYVSLNWESQMGIALAPWTVSRNRWQKG